MTGFVTYDGTKDFQTLFPEAYTMLSELFVNDTTNAAAAVAMAGDTMTGGLVVLAPTLGTHPARVDGINTRRKFVTTRIMGFPSDPEGVFAFICPEANKYAIESAFLVSDTTTASSDGSNHYTFTLLRAPSTGLQSTVPNTGTTELTAFSAYNLNVDQNNATSDLAANSVFLFVIDKVGTPTTDLVAAELMVQINLTETIL